MNFLQTLPKQQQLTLPLFRGAEGDAKTLADCIDEVLAAKRLGNRTGRYVKGLNYYLRQFAHGREKLALKDVSVEAVEAWLGRYENMHTRATWRNRLSTLLAFAARRHYITANPCEAVEPVTVETPPPVVLTPEQADLLVATVRETCRAYLALGLFAGVRPEEMLKLDWAQIDLTAGTVSLLGKGRKRRLVPLEPRAVAARVVI